MVIKYQGQFNNHNPDFQDPYKGHLIHDSTPTNRAYVNRWDKNGLDVASTGEPLKTESWGGGSSSDTYLYSRGINSNDGFDDNDEPRLYDGSADDTNAVHASVSTRHSGAHGNTTYPPQDLLEPGPGPGTYDWPPTPLEDWMPPASHRQDVGQISLFKHQSRPAQSSVEGMFSTKSGRLHAMGALGVAASDTMHNQGRALQPSTNLSKHSSRIVNNLQERGAVDKDKVYGASNGLDFWEQPMSYIPGSNSEVVTPDRLAAGKRTLRSVIGSRGQSRAGQQMELPFG